MRYSAALCAPHPSLLKQLTCTTMQTASCLLRAPSCSGCGILRCREFDHLGWETQGIPAATMSDILRCHDWNYVRSIANVGSTGEAWLGMWGQVWE